MKELGSEVVRQPEVARQAKKFPQIMIERRPVVCPQGGAHRSQEIETRSSREEAENHDRTGRRRDPLFALSERLIQDSSRESQNPIFVEHVNHDRTERAVVCSERAPQTRFSRDSTNFNPEEETNHDETRCLHTR